MSRLAAYNDAAASRPAPYLPDPNLPTEYGVYNGYVPASQEAKASAKKYYRQEVIPALKADNKLGMTADEYARHRFEVEKPTPIQESVIEVTPQAAREVTMGNIDPYASPYYGTAILNKRNKYARKIARQERRDERLTNRFVNAATNGNMNRANRILLKMEE